MAGCLDRIQRLFDPDHGSTQSTPLPRLAVAMVAMVFLANNFSLVVVYPLIPFMVSSYFPDLNADELGWKAGYLGAIFNVGQLIGAIAWGRLGDKYGRRRPMLAGIFGTMVSIILFGFSPNYYMALFARFLWGAANGNVGLGKAYLSDICDDTNQARGFAYLGMTGGIGRLIGPALGGFLAQPAQKWPNTFSPTGVFGRFEFVLPCLVGFALALLSLVMAFFYLEESTEVRDRGAPSDDSPHASDPEEDDARAPTKAHRHHAFSEVVEDDAVSAEAGLLADKRVHVRRDEADAVAALRQRRSGAQRGAPSSLLALMRERNVMLACSLYALMGLGTQMLTEVWPLWVLLPVSQGGFHMASGDIGLLMMGAAPIQLLAQLIIYPRVVKRIGFLSTFRRASIWIAVVTFIAPFISVTAGVTDHSMPEAIMAQVNNTMTTVASRMAGVPASVQTASSKEAGWLGWLASELAWSAISCVWMWSFIASFSLINNSTYPSDKATANGIGQSMVAITRTIGPLVGGMLFAWSASSGNPWPLDFHLVFHLTGLVYLGTAAVSLLLPKSIDKSRLAAESEDPDFGNDDQADNGRVPLLAMGDADDETEDDDQD